MTSSGFRNPKLELSLEGRNSRQCRCFAWNLLNKTCHAWTSAPRLPLSKQDVVQPPLHCESHQCEICQWLERMFIIMLGQGHDISMVAWIDYVLTQTYIISGVVDPHDFVAIQTVVDNANLPVFLYWAFTGVSWPGRVQRPSQKMIMQFGMEVLFTLS